MIEQAYVYQPAEREDEGQAIKHGVVIFLVNDDGKILVGFHMIANGRGNIGDLTLIGESRELKETKKQTIERGLDEELGGKNRTKTSIPANIRDAWLGSIAFAIGEKPVNAQVFCFKWNGGSEVPPVNTNGNSEANDFMPCQWAGLEELNDLEVITYGETGQTVHKMRSGMQRIISKVLENSLVVAKINQISKQ